MQVRILFGMKNLSIYFKKIHLEVQIYYNISEGMPSAQILQQLLEIKQDQAVLWQ